MQLLLRHLLDQIAALLQLLIEAAGASFRRAAAGRVPKQGQVEQTNLPFYPKRQEDVTVLLCVLSCCYFLIDAAVKHCTTASTSCSGEPTRPHTRPPNPTSQPDLPQAVPQSPPRAQTRRQPHRAAAAAARRLPPGRLRQLRRHGSSRCGSGLKVAMLRARSTLPYPTLALTLTLPYPTLP